ncbi:MAG: T9SS type A sorting domain-containing protein, partial [Bacteroidia bacterium]|nr:T9SS type A sorting domain-containing protein [Bacteroidia bacterium]
NQVSLGIETVVAQAELKIFPNPVSMVLNILKPDDMTINSVRLYSISGQLIKETEFSEHVSMDALPSGMYILQMETDEGLINKSVIKH